MPWVPREPQVWLLWPRPHPVLLSSEESGGKPPRVLRCSRGHPRSSASFPPSTFTNSYLDSTKEIDRQKLSVGKFCMHRLHRTSSADEAHTQCCPVSTPIVINHLSNAAGAASKIVLLTYFVMRLFVILVLPFLSVTASAAEFNVGLSYG